MRQFGVLHAADSDGAFPVSIWFGWLVQLAMQIITQPGSLPGGAAAANAPTVAAFAFGLNFMPAYLDSKARNTPDVLGPEYYGIAPSEGETGVDDKVALDIERSQSSQRLEL